MIYNRLHTQASRSCKNRVKANHSGNDSFASSKRDLSGFVLLMLFLLTTSLVGCVSLHLPTTPTKPATSNPSPDPDHTQPSTGDSLPTTDSSHPSTGNPLPTSTAPSDQPFYIPSYLPPGLRDSFELPPGYTATSNPEETSFHIDLWDPASRSTQSLTWWTYALVAPFPTIPSDVHLQDIQLTWGGQPSGPFAGLPLLMDEPTRAVLSAWWGEPAPGVVQTATAETLLDTAWAQRPSCAIVPFEALEPHWKVLSINGFSPLSRDFDPATYPLNVPFTLTTPPGLYDWQLPIGNRDPNQLTSVAMTGVTALVRGTALWMERYGIPYPAQDVGSLLASADITHINNEVPFFADCPYPELNTPWLVSCSPPAYIELLDLVGADVIELSGDHFGDWPAASMDLTLSIYTDHGMATYGGGLNAEDARQPALFEHNGNRLAFIGCHISDEIKTETPPDALATDDLPGAAECDFAWLQSEIPRLINQGYQVIFTFQHQEIYTYTASEQLVADFSLPAQMGAVIVSGSQAHQPHGFAFQSGAFVHYGLGNLFFDQFHYCADYACDNAFIDRHVFYHGKHISTELIPIKFVDLARPRLMTADEAARFLKLIFSASGW